MSTETCLHFSVDVKVALPRPVGLSVTFGNVAVMIILLNVLPLVSPLGPVNVATLSVFSPNRPQVGYSSRLSNILHVLLKTIEIEQELLNYNEIDVSLSPNSLVSFPMIVYICKMFTCQIALSMFSLSL